MVKLKRKPENTACDKEVVRKNKITLKWFTNFLKRQSYLSLCKGDAAANVQLHAMTPETLKNYFDLLDKTLTEHNLKQSPAQIYNVDETGVAFNIAQKLL